MQRAAGPYSSSQAFPTIELRPAGELEVNTDNDLDLRPAGDAAKPSSALLSLRGRQAVVHEAFGVGGLAPGQMLGLRR